MTEIPATAQLGPIACVTATAPDLDAVTDAYSRYFDYQLIGSGAIDDSMASLWQADALAGSPYVLLSPPAGDECVFRFVQAPRDEHYVPFSTYGWNAAEIMVENVDQMAERLIGSPFKVVGEPQNLSFSEDIRAMQIVGPGHELLYLTEFKKPLPGLDVPVARCAVDRVFIVILGGPSMSGLQDWYSNQFSVPGAEPVDSRVKGMSAAFGKSPEHRYPIAALPLAGKTLIEVDEMPPEAVAREASPDGLVAGISIVSFLSRKPDVPETAIRLNEQDPPYRYGEHVSCMKGAAGELLEIIYVD